jgi:hypothetical protein
MIIGSSAIYFIVMTLLGSPYGTAEIVMLLICSLIYFGSYQFMARVGTPKLAPNGQVLDPGLDLNMAEGMAEHVKDLVILTSGAHVLSLLTNYLWLLLLLAPMRAFWMLWRSVISPWLFAPREETDEADDSKKQKKLERKMRRMR